MKPTPIIKDPKDIFVHCGPDALHNAPVEEWQPPDSASHTTNGTGEIKVQRPLWMYATNDRGNAEAFVDRAGHIIRYVPERGIWLIWGGERWMTDNTRTGLNQLIDENERQWLREVADIPASISGDADDARKAASKRALAFGNHRCRENVITMAQHNPEIILKGSDLDGDAWLVGVLNGVLDLKTGRLIYEPRQHYVTKSLSVHYDPTATCPRWERFVLEVMNGDEELANYLQRCAGYTLTGTMEEQVFWFLYGSGSNGKSTFLDVMNRLLGGYAASASADLFVKKPNGASCNVELSALPGVRFLTGSETQEGDRLNENIIKDITGGDSIGARAHYSPPFSFRPQCKIWMFGNHRPSINGTDHGIWRRVRLIPFTCQFAKDDTLKSQLNAEMPGILNWMLRGCENWQRDGLGLPPAITAASSAYKTACDLLSDFITDSLVRESGASAKKRDVYKAYQEWCRDNGHSHPWTSQKLSTRLKDRGMVTDERDRLWLDWTVRVI